MLESSAPARPPGASAAELALQVRGLQAWYGESHVLHGIDLEVRRGEVVTLLGRNGAGKTTTLKSIMGVLRRRTGSIVVNGSETISWRSRHVARQGLGYVPEERGIYAALSVEENLFLPPPLQAGGLSVEEIFAMFPNLKERLSSQGTKLSGGEQQMLAMARILRTGAQLLLLDEPTEGLAPIIVEQIQRVLAKLKERGYTILLVEQNFRFATSLADRHYIVDQGAVVDTLSNSEVLRDDQRVMRYLGV